MHPETELNHGVNVVDGGMLAGINPLKSGAGILREAEVSVYAPPENFAAYRNLSQRDALTGLFNSRYFERLLGVEMNRARREMLPLSLIIMGLDDFGRYADRCGQAMGEAAIKKTAWTLLHNCRRGDLVARYGDGKFAIILPRVSRPTAAIVANRIRLAVEGIKFEQADVLPKGVLTASLGVTEYPTDAAGRDDLIEKANLALCRAWNNGKNRVCMSKSPA